MTEERVISIFKEAVILVFKLAGPMLIISMIVGLVIAILQAATQVHEQTLTFVPKALTIIVLLFAMASFFVSASTDFMGEIMSLVETVSTQTVTA